MAVQVIDETLACDCCVVAAANADTSGHDYYCDGEPEPLILITKGWAVVGEPYADFSRLPCGGCGSRLAGARHHMSVLL